MTAQAWSWVLSLIGVAWVLAAGRGKWWAWWLGLFAEAVWITYAIVTRQYGFVFGSLVYAAAHTHNILTARKVIE